MFELVSHIIAGKRRSNRHVNLAITMNKLSDWSPNASFRKPKILFASFHDLRYQPRLMDCWALDPNVSLHENISMFTTSTVWQKETWKLLGSEMINSTRQLMSSDLFDPRERHNGLPLSLVGSSWEFTSTIVCTIVRICFLATGDVSGSCTLMWTAWGRVLL